MQMICGLLYIRLSPSSRPSRQDVQSRCFPSLCPPSLVLRGVSLFAEVLPAVPSSHFFSSSAPTQLARLFVIKTSKLTGFNRVRFTLVVTTVYYLLRRPIPATSFRSLILSHKSRPPKTPPPTLFTLAMRFHPLLFHTFATPHPPFSPAMPFTPSTEYRSTPRNVVLAFARVPFYPSAWRLIRVSSPHHSSLPILPCCPPSLFISCPNAHLFTIPRRLFRFLMLIQRITFRTFLAEVQIRDYEGGQLPSADLWKMKMAWKCEQRWNHQSGK